MTDQEFPRCDDVTEATEIFAAYQDPDPRISQFAKFIATRLNPGRPIDVPSFALLTQMALCELQAGVDVTGEVLENELAGIDDEEADDLYRAVPELARVAFGSEFSGAIKRQFMAMGIIPHEETRPGEDLTENEIITDDIDNIDDAYERIILDAKTRILALDWQHYGVGDEDVGLTFEILFPTVLRQSPCHLPLTTLVDEPGRETGLLLEVLPTQKQHLSNTQWLAMMIERIPADMATFTRDYLFTKISEVIAIYYELDLIKAMTHLGYTAGTSSPLTRAAIRMRTYLQENPGIVRKGS